MTVNVRYWAGARAAAGTAEETYDAQTLGSLLMAIRQRHTGRDLPGVLARCSYLVDEVSPGTRAPDDVVLAPGAVIEVLPPFAGGSGDRRLRGPGPVDQGTAGHGDPRQADVIAALGRAVQP